MKAPLKKLSLESLEPRLLLSRSTPMLTMALAPRADGSTAGASRSAPAVAATLAGGDRPAGRMLFQLETPNGHIVDSEWIHVHGNGTYRLANTALVPQSDAFTWHVRYFGDMRNFFASDRVSPAETGTASAQSAPSSPDPLPSAIPSFAPSSQLDPSSGATAAPSALTARTVVQPPVVLPKSVGYQTFYQTAKTDKTLPSKQAYYRYDWAQIEPAFGVYDFSAMQRDLTAAEAAGQQCNFRIMPYEDGGGGPVALKNAGLSGTSFKFNGATTFQPNLGSPAVQADLDKLLAALGARFAGHTATIDVGWWGSYGEWSNWGTMPALARPSTAATEWLISETKRYFPQSYTIVQASLAVDDPASFAFAMAADCGVRYDGWGDWSTSGQWSGQDNLYPAVIAATGDQWKRAPIILEPSGTFSSWLGSEPWQKSFDWAINTAHAWMFSNKSSGPIPAVMQSYVNQLLAAESPTLANISLAAAW
jgi:hypothetical protein